MTVTVLEVLCGALLLACAFFGIMWSEKHSESKVFRRLFEEEMRRHDRLRQRHEEVIDKLIGEEEA